MRPSFTLGIEEEYQTIDPETRDLRSHIATEMLAEGKLRLEERVKAEMHQSVIEVGTRVCANIQEAQEDLFDLRRNMIQLAEKNGLVLVAGATHPFADWRVQEIYPDPRYAKVVEDLQLVARANLIFGLHVHVGIEDREAAIRHELPAIFLATYSGAVYELAVLAGNEDGVQELSGEGV
jgi:carboxylate-amine ligase